MSKQIIFDTEARDAMLRGVEKLSSAVKVTGRTQKVVM